MSRRYDRRGGSPTDRLVRRGLAGVRSAAPSSGVWSRIEAELGPPLGRAPRPLWRFTLPMATLAATVCLVLLGLGSLSLGLGPQRAAVVRLGGSPPALTAPDIVQAERVGAPVAVPLRLAVTLPLPGQAAEPAPARLPGWHRPQLALNRAPWPMVLARSDLERAEAMAEARLE